MPDVVVAPVVSRGDRREFLRLAETIYRDDPNWVPPLLDNIKRMLGWKRHPFHEIAEVQTFLARRDGQVVGRIAAILNREHNRVHKEHRGFFGFFESIDDQQVADALFQAVAVWFAERNITALRGPANPSMNYECGLLIEGFDEPPTFMMTYNPPYYQRLIENFGFRKSQDLLAFIGYADQLPAVQQKLAPLVEQAKQRSGVTLRSLQKTHFRQDVEMFLEMYNRACVTMWGFVPLTRGEMYELARSMKHLLVPELALGADAEGQTVGVVLGLPDFNPAIKQIRGRLFPFGFIKLLRAKYHAKRIRIISIAVVPEFQRWGVGMVLMAGLVPKGVELGMQEAEFSWIVETNDMAILGLEKGGAKLYKTYRMFDFDPPVQ